MQADDTEMREDRVGEDRLEPLDDLAERWSRDGFIWGLAGFPWIWIYGNAGRRFGLIALFTRIAFDISLVALPRIVAVCSGRSDVLLIDSTIELAMWSWVASHPIGALILGAVGNSISLKYRQFADRRDFTNYHTVWFQRGVAVWFVSGVALMALVFYGMMVALSSLAGR